MVCRAAPDQPLSSRSLSLAKGEEERGSPQVSPSPAEEGLGGEGDFPRQQNGHPWSNPFPHLLTPTHKGHGAGDWFRSARRRRGRRSRSTQTARGCTTGAVRRAAITATLSVHQLAFPRTLIALRTELADHRIAHSSQAIARGAWSTRRFPSGAHVLPATPLVAEHARSALAVSGASGYDRCRHGRRG